MRRYGLPPELCRLLMQEEHRTRESPGCHTLGRGSACVRQSPVPSVVGSHHPPLTEEDIWAQGGITECWDCQRS